MTLQISHNGEILSANCSDSDESDSAKWRTMEVVRMKRKYDSIRRKL